MATFHSSLPSLPCGGDADGEVHGHDARVARAQAARRRRAERRASSSAGDYAAIVRRVAYRFAVKRFGWAKADDIAQATLEKFCADPAGIMAQYPDPQAFAIAVARTTGIDLDRRERAQRGEGANLRPNADGQLDVARIVISTDEVTDVRPGADIAEIVVAGLTITAILDQLEPLDRLLLELRYVDDHKVGEIASILGMVSSTVSRRITRARAIVAEFVVAR